MDGVRKMKSATKQRAKHRNSDARFGHQKRCYKPDSVQEQAPCVMICLATVLPQQSLQLFREPKPADTALHTGKDLAVSPPLLPEGLIHQSKPQRILIPFGQSVSARTS